MTLRTHHSENKGSSARFIAPPVVAALRSTCVYSLIVILAAIETGNVSATEGEVANSAGIENLSGLSETATRAVRDGAEPIDARPGRIPFVFGVSFDVPSSAGQDTAPATPSEELPVPTTTQSPAALPAATLRPASLPPATLPPASLRRQLLPQADASPEALPPPVIEPSEPLRSLPLIPSRGADRVLPKDLLDLESVTVQPVEVDGSGKVTAPWLDIRPRTIGDDDATLISSDQLPTDTSGLERQDSVPRLIQLYQADLLMRDIWSGASFCHRPLYFEDQRLERCGSIGTALRHCPSVHSGVHFFWKASSLPISLVIDPPCECVRSGCKPTGFLSRLR